MERVTTDSSEAVQIRKRFDEQTYGLPSIVYEIDSRRNDPVSVRIVETLPQDVDADHIGFHRRVARERWQKSGRTLTFEGEVESNGEHTTVYALHPEFSGDTEAFIERSPTLEVTPTEDGPDASPAVAAESTQESEPDSDKEDEPTDDDGDGDSPADEVEQASSADADDLAQPVDEDSSDQSAAADDPAHSMNADDTRQPTNTDPQPSPAADAERTATADEKDSAPRADGDTAASPADDAATPDGTNAGQSQGALQGSEVDADLLVDRLVSELRAGAVSEEQLSYLRAQFTRESGLPESADARIEGLQRDVADLRAYTDALERLLDTHGDEDDIVGEFERQFDAVEQRLADVESRLDDQESHIESRLDDQASDIETLRSDVASLEESLEATATELSATRDELATLSETTDDLAAELPASDVDARLDELDERIEELSKFVDSLREAFQD